MANPRKLITAAVADYLKAPLADDGAAPGAPKRFLTDAKARAYDTDTMPPDADAMPEINVLFVREIIDETTQHDGGPRRRLMEMHIECYHNKGKAEVDDLAWQVEEAMRANSSVNNLVEWCKLTDLHLFIVENHTVSLFCVVMNFDVIYWTHEVKDETTGRPKTVLLGIDPEVGPGHEPDYSEVIGG